MAAVLRGATQRGSTVDGSCLAGTTEVYVDVDEVADTGGEMTCADAGAGVVSLSTPARIPLLGGGGLEEPLEREIGVKILGRFRDTETTRS